MKGWIIFTLVLVVIASFSFVAANINFDAKIHASKHEFLPYEFSTFTSAVCENKEEVVFCKDEVFVNCNGEISKAIDVAECNGIKLDVPKATGFATFGKEWKDPRG